MEDTPAASASASAGPSRRCNAIKCNRRTFFGLLVGSGLLVLACIASVFTEPVQRIMSVEDPEIYKQTLRTSRIRAKKANKRNKALVSVTSDATEHPSKKQNTTLESLEQELDMSGNSPPHVHLTRNGAIDWTQYDHLQLYHTRKAGGSSLYDWAKHVAKKHNLTLAQQEGTVYDPRDWRGMMHLGRVFVFTSLRPPVDRVISSYEYDGLQTIGAHAQQRKRRKQNDPSIIDSPTLLDFVKHANDANEGKNGSRNIRHIWRDGIGGGNINNKQNSINDPRKKKRARRQKKKWTRLARGWVWQCATDCYSKWFGAWPQPDLEPHTQLAAQNLDELEIVWMNSLQDEKYMQWFLHRWDATDIPLGHKRKTADRVHQNYTQEEMTLLHNSNRKDELLYEALRKKWSAISNMQLQ
ncbi:expressed unknown protein [Seminavis robusta]|uniref:Uncharacterized protein n=1 Tax=Seminavis robusta TaxID=568900 RepID=A0A9N8DC66_9STRA|nr:expressed unknown protein [Seminavis robusta]|eukprot:Sro81_g043400.1 n/a (411) ;mRNA; f:31066-32298